MESIEKISKNIENEKESLISLDFLIPNLNEENFLQEKIIKCLNDADLNNIVKAVNIEGAFSELAVDSIIYRIGTLFYQLQFEQNIDVSTFALSNSEELKICLLILVKTSAKELQNFESIKEVASKAIATLNAARISFSEMDLCDICIPGADLSYGIFDGTQFQRATLTGVSFEGAWLREADFSNACMEDIYFGENPYLKLSDWIEKCCYSHDGKSLAIASRNDIFLYNAATLNRIRTFGGHTKEVKSIAFSLDDKWLASGSRDETVHLWNTATGDSKIFKSLKEKGSIIHVAFSPDSEQLVVVYIGMTIRFWDIVSGQEKKSLKVDKLGVNCIAFTPDGLQLASGGLFGDIRLWDVATGQEMKIFNGHTGHISDLAFSRDGKELVSSGGHIICLWDITSGQQKKIFEGHMEEVTSVTFSPNGQQLASSSEDKTVRLWDVITGQQIKVFEGHTGKVSSVAFNPDGKRLVSSSGYSLKNELGDKTIRFWDITIGRKKIFEQYINSVLSIAFSPDGQQLVSGSGDHDGTEHTNNLLARALNSSSFKHVHFKDNTVRLWDTATGEVRQIFKGHTECVLSVAFSPDGLYLASGSGDKTLCLWDITSGQLKKIFKGHKDWVTSVVFSPNGLYLASGSGNNITDSLDKSIRLWNIATGKEERIFEGHTASVTGIAFSPDGKKLVSSSGDKTLRLWDIATGSSKVFERSDMTGWFSSVAFSPSGQQLVSGNWDKTLYLWDITTGKEQKIFKGHTKEVISLAFSPDGLQLASGGKDGSLRLWSVATGKCLLCLDIGSYVNSICFTKTKQRLFLATASDDKSIRYWGVEHIGNSVRLQLLWSSYQSVLVASNANLKGVVDLSPNNTELLKQRGAQGKKFLGREKNTFYLRTEGTHISSVKSVSFSPNGQYIASGGDHPDNTVKLWNAESGELLDTFMQHSKSVESVAFSSDGKYLASGSDDGTLVLLDMVNRSILKTINNLGKVLCVVFSPNRQLLAYLNATPFPLRESNKDAIRFFDIKNMKLLPPIEGHMDMIRCIAFSPDGKYLASGGHDKKIRIWDVVSGTLWKTLESDINLVAEGWIRSIAFSADGKYLAFGGHDKKIRIWDVVKERHLNTLKGHNGIVTSVVFNTNGLQLASGDYNLSGNRTIRFWDITTGKCLLVFDMFSQVNSICLTETKQGILLAVGSSDNAVHCWRVENLEDVVRLQPIWSNGQRDLKTKMDTMKSNFSINSRSLKTDEDLKLEAPGLRPDSSSTESKEFHNMFRGVLSNKLNKELFIKKYELKDDSQQELERGLRKAAVNNKIDDLDFFIQLVNINAKDPKKGKTALHAAVSKGFFGCVEKLLSKGADPTIQDFENKTPAMYTDDDKILRLLNEKILNNKRLYPNKGDTFN